MGRAGRVGDRDRAAVRHRQSGVHQEGGAGGIDAEDIDLLCVLGVRLRRAGTGVTEDDGVTSTPPTRDSPALPASASSGRIPVLMVRMNADLLMGEDLKKTGAGNLFTVFGEPDIERRRDGDGHRVEIKGVDVYDPTTGEVRSNDTEPDRPMDDRHGLQRGVVLRPPLLLHRRQRPVQAAEDAR